MMSKSTATGRQEPRVSSRLQIVRGPDAAVGTPTPEVDVNDVSTRPQDGSFVVRSLLNLR